MGETCGMKLLNETLYVKGDCRLCQTIQAKKRKMQKAKDDYARWKDDPQRQASAGVKIDELKELHMEIVRLEEERRIKSNSVGNPRRADGRVQA